MSIIQDILAEQTRQGLKHGDIAKQLGWSGPKFHRIKTGKQPVKVEELEAWANVVFCEITYSLKRINPQKE